MSRSFGFGVYALAAFCAAGCGGVTPASGDSGATRGETDGAITAEQGCAQEARAFCDALNGCAATWMKLLYGDLTTCISRASLSCMDDQSVTGTSRTPADLAACAQAVATASCPDLVAAKLPAACTIKPGAAINGTACGSDWQCQSTYCSKRGQCGVCGPRAAAGGTCTVDGGCQPGLVCANSKCVTPGLSGATCDTTNQPCAGGLYCGKDGKCAAKLGAGAPCADLPDGACDIIQGLGCSGKTHTCEVIGVAKGGEACFLVNGVFTVCVGLNPCRNVNAQLAGVCASPAGDGEACGPGLDELKCVAPATCEAGLCRLPSAPSCK
jgi:hypothetical protein